jgi:hypothetical protein
LYRQAARLSSMDDLVDAATRIRDRELHELYHSMKLGGASKSEVPIKAARKPAAAAAVAVSSSGDLSQQRAGLVKGSTVVSASPVPRTSAGRVDDDDDDDGELDEEDFKRWLASTKAAGGRLAGDDDSCGSLADGTTEASSHKRSW